MIDLTAELRSEWDAALTTGYLRDLEAAYQAGRLRTYHLFPAGRLKGGLARVTATKPLGDRAALDMFHALEIACGVSVVEGRGWYGVRRAATDLAEDLETDTRALNAITGHTSDATRIGYQEKLRNATLAKATTTREAARREAMSAAENWVRPTGERTVSVWERRKLEKQRRRLAAHPVPVGRKKGGKRAALEKGRGANVPHNLPQSENEGEG